ncbi:alpha/beta-hydrolase [Microstroma glucosiphilum]|uniref:Alpha/beta-hydrolase n=1 Tax=Pseudomicrostroma glucosiphilum TaxID=1684307 RepID=A0A316U175_9BASI|nr:alpha/beta-hydrolase [Pseudomicrostroma glucosiphilum]PWN19047.1 alpha/beta-hydrolase [Pseudomicrostroma glucosiphilum]
MSCARALRVSLSLLLVGAFAIAILAGPASASPSSLATSATLTNLGTVKPATLSNAVRYTLPYAQPPVGGLRFANTLKLGTLPSNYSAAVQASGCMQSGDSTDDGVSFSEDCLFMDVYVPANATTSSALPVLVWLPGGSFIGGSARNAGLDGSLLAAEQNIIVVIMQYRLGVFGWLQTASTFDETKGGAAGSSTVAGNQAVRDVVMALTFIQDHVGSLGGDKSKVTLAGQSSGGHMVRALLGTPAADDLFSQAIIASDPENYGASSVKTQNVLGDSVLLQLWCSTLSCARKASASKVLEASEIAFSTAHTFHSNIPAGEPWRPMLGSYISGDVQKNASAGPKRKVIFSTVPNEAGAVVGANIGATAANAKLLPLASIPWFKVTLQFAADIFYSGGRGTKLATNAAYEQNSTSVGQKDGLRALLEGMGTDGTFRCSSQHTALALATAGHKVYIAEHHQGYTYPDNADIDYCTESGKVCHEDDIYLVFGTYPADATSAVVAASKELRARWGAFVRGGTPNADGYPMWSTTKSVTELNVLQLGAKSDGASGIASQQRLQACSVWGSTVQYDWQMYG